MANINIPHFDYPFRFGADGHAICVEQNTAEDVINCVTAAAKTLRGSRYFVSNFGIDDPTFSTEPVDIPTVEAQLRESEPRADLISGQTFDQFINTLTVGVGPIE